MPVLLAMPTVADTQLGRHAFPSHRLIHPQRQVEDIVVIAAVEEPLDCMELSQSGFVGIRHKLDGAGRDQ